MHTREQGQGCNTLFGLNKTWNHSGSHVQLIKLGDLVYSLGVTNFCFSLLNHLLNCESTAALVEI